jgi:hypothetical protein
MPILGAVTACLALIGPGHYLQPTLDIARVIVSATRRAIDIEPWQSFPVGMMTGDRRFIAMAAGIRPSRQPLTPDGARRIAANIAKPPDWLRRRQKSVPHRNRMPPRRPKRKAPRIIGAWGMSANPGPRDCRFSLRSLEPMSCPPRHVAYVPTHSGCRSNVGSSAMAEFF